MRTSTNEKVAPSPKSATRTTNELKPTTRAAQGARGSRRFGMSVGEAIINAAALVATAQASVRGMR